MNTGEAIAKWWTLVRRRERQTTLGLFLTLRPGKSEYVIRAGAAHYTGIRSHYYYGLEKVCIVLDDRQVDLNYFLTEPPEVCPYDLGYHNDIDPLHLIFHNHYNYDLGVELTLALERVLATTAWPPVLRAPSACFDMCLEI